MTRRELLMKIFQRHLVVTNDQRKIPISLKPFALDEFWFTAFPKADLEEFENG